MRRWIVALAFVCTFACISAAEDWPQWMGKNRDGRWDEAGTLEKFPAEGPKVLWRKPVHGGYAGPAVVAGKVYHFDYVRPEGKLNNNPAFRTKLDGEERIVCFDAKTGEQLWERKYPCKYEISYASGPRCTPTVDDGKVYALGSEGNLSCLDANSGSEIWAKDLKAEYKTKSPIWGFCSHPLVDGDKLILGVGGKSSTVVAFDKKTGKELWKAVDAKEQGYCPPTIYQVGKSRQLIHWNAEAVVSLDPETGKVYWSEKLAPEHGMSIMAPRLEGNLLFMGAIGFKSMCLELDTDQPAAKVLWKGDRTKSLCPINATPIIEDGHIYGCDQPGQLRCVEMKTGKRLWETTQPTTGKPATNRDSGSGTAFLVKNGDKYYIMAETGHLIVAKLSPKGYEEISRVKILEPTNDSFGRPVVWSHPAFADKCCFARNDKEIVCISLAKE